ncbi:MAG: hypothetical protein NE327_15400 [Lentisphaeraceae bacterium]|nr:hypothetical protein [Lentisphaeraceae bacterium]
MKINLKVLYLFWAVTAFCTGLSFAEENKEVAKINREVKKIMEMMNIHQFGLYQMATNDMYLSKDFKTASNEIIKYATQMKGIKHPDKKFVKTNKDMLQELENFKAALKSEQKEKIKSSWQSLSKTCTACHVLYNVAK